jgi:membrane protein DedA with SNARE-associated domain
MNLLKFSVYTIVGAGLWNAFLTYVGFKLKSNWDEVMKYSHTIDLVVIAILGGAFIYYLYKIYLSFNQKKTAS